MAEVGQAPPDPSAPAGCGLKMTISASAALPSWQQHRRPQPPGELVTSSPRHFAACSPASECTVGTDPEWTVVAAGTTLLGGYYGAGHHPPASSLRGSIAHGGEKNLCVSSRGCRVIHVPKQSEAGILCWCFSLFPQWAAGPELGSPTLGLGGAVGDAPDLGRVALAPFDHLGQAQDFSTVIVVSEMSSSPSSPLCLQVPGEEGPGGN